MADTLEQKNFEEHLKRSQIIIETTEPESTIHLLGKVTRTLPISTFAVKDGQAYCGECGDTLTNHDPFLRRDYDAQCPRCDHYISPRSPKQLGFI